MIKYFLLVITGLLSVYLSKAQIVDDFSDGDFSNNPEWTGKISNFEVDSLSRLHLNAPAEANSSYLSTPSRSIENASWEFTVGMDFNPSGSNYTQVYLAMDNENPENAQNALYVKLGGTSDEVSLYKIVNGENVSEIIDGWDDILDAPSIIVKVRVEKTPDSLLLYADTSLIEQEMKMGAVAWTSSSFSSTHFGIECVYTSTRSSKFYFDDFIVIGTPETAPPYITDFNTPSLDKVNIIFNEPLNPTSVIPSHFSIDGNPPASAILSQGNTVNLTFSSAFPNGSKKQLIISGVEDVARNVMEDTSLSAMFFVPQSIQPGDVAINEIFPDPTPMVGLPEEEYIEIINLSDNPVVLDSLNIYNTHSRLSLSERILSPGEILVITSKDGETALRKTGIQNVVSAESWIALSNSTDSLTIVANGQIIDMVKYDLSYYQDEEKDNGGWSIEAQNPAENCLGVSNFSASMDVSGGTPGRQNSVYTSSSNTTPVFPIAHEIEGLGKITFTFNKPVIETGKAVVNIEPSIPLISTEVFGNQAVVEFLDMQFGVAYLLRFQNLKDCIGNTILSSPYQITVGEKPTPGDIIITEIMADPTPSFRLPELEYIEIYNPSDKFLSMEGVQFNGKSITQNIIMKPGDYLVLSAGTSGFPLTQKVVAVEGLSVSSLSNTAGTALLEDEEGNILAEVNYNASWHTNERAKDGGYSLELISTGLKCYNHPSFWKTSSADTTGGTPGAQNSVSDTFLHRPPVLSHVFLSPNDKLCLQLSTPVDTASSQWAWSTLWGIPQYNSSLDKVCFQGFQPFEEITLYTLNAQAKNCNDTLQVELFSLPVFQPVVPQIGNLVLNEILFDPEENMQEYVELYNVSNDPIWLLNTALSTDEQLLEEDIIDTAGKILFPGDFVVLSKDSANLFSHYPFGNSKKHYFPYQIPFLTNEGSFLGLLYRGEILDEVIYSAELHHPALKETKGVALERISPKMVENIEDNWTSSSFNANYGTPGAKNAQFLDFSSQSELMISPELISPNGDGLDDNTVISITTSQVNHAANVYIFDNQGRKIKTISENTVLGAVNVFTWKGITNDNVRVEPGIYLILVEIFDGKGKVSRKKATVTVG